MGLQNKMKFKDYQDTIVIDLNKQQAMNKKVRWSYNKALKNNIVLKKTELHELKEIHELIVAHGEENNYKSYSMDRLLNSLDSDLMFTALFEGMIIGVLILSDNDDGLKVDTCVCNKRYKNLEVYTFLWVKAIEIAKWMNKSSIDLGGIYVDAKPSTKYYNITRFKERLGGEVVRKELYFNNLIYVIGRKMVRFCKRNGLMK